MSLVSCQKTHFLVPVSDSIVELDLEDGDVLTMEGRLQRHCLHFVPKCNPREPLRDERINITFRWVREHRYRCPLRWRHAESMDRTLSAIIGSLDRLEGEDSRLLPLSLRFHGGAYVRDWSQQVCPGVLNPEQQLRLCDGCKHVCYAEGRPCCEGLGDWTEQWFCRRCWLHWEPEAFSEPPSLEAWCVPNYSENWEKWETIGPYDTGVLEAVEPIMPDHWNMRPAFALWCGAWEQLQLLGEIQSDAQLLKLETPSTLPSGEGLALFAAGTYPAREYIVEGGRWMIAVNKEGLDEVWLAMCQGLLQGLFDGQAGACGVAATLSSSRDGKLAVWLLKAQDDLHVLAVGSVFMDLLRAKGLAGRLKFENFQRTKVTSGEPRAIDAFSPSLILNVDWLLRYQCALEHVSPQGRHGTPRARLCRIKSGGCQILAQGSFRFSSSKFPDLTCSCVAMAVAKHQPDVPVKATDDTPAEELEEILWVSQGEETVASATKSCRMLEGHRAHSETESAWKKGGDEQPRTSTRFHEGASNSSSKRSTSKERNHMRQTCKTALNRLEAQYTNLELLPEDLDVERGSIKRLVLSWQFRWLVFCVILLNMVIISVVESIWEYDEISHVSLMVERVALVFYILELVLRLYAGSR
eukprot:s1165_g4.t2